jgi:hypothetical protein
LQPDGYSKAEYGYCMMEDGSSYIATMALKMERVFREESTPASMLCEEYLKKVLIHGTTEAQQLSVFLPSLYAEYKGKPDDAD